MCYQPPGTDVGITFKSSLMRGRFIIISEVRFDATRVAPELALSQQSLYLRFANTKFSRHIFYGHSFFRGISLSFSKSRGVALRPALPLFRLGTLTGMF